MSIMKWGSKGSETSLAYKEQAGPFDDFNISNPDFVSC